VGLDRASVLRLRGSVAIEFCKARLGGRYAVVVFVDLCDLMSDLIRSASAGVAGHHNRAVSLVSNDETDHRKCRFKKWYSKCRPNSLVFQNIFVPETFRGEVDPQRKAHA
jgi:hypothetical protein